MRGLHRGGIGGADDARGAVLWRSLLGHKQAVTIAAPSVYRGARHTAPATAQRYASAGTGPTLFPAERNPPVNRVLQMRGKDSERFLHETVRWQQEQYQITNPARLHVIDFFSCTRRGSPMPRLNVSTNSWKLYLSKLAGAAIKSIVCPAHRPTPPLSSQRAESARARKPSREIKASRKLAAGLATCAATTGSKPFGPSSSS